MEKIMGELAKIFGGNITDGVAKIISLFKIDPTIALQNQTQILQIQSEMQGKMLDAAATQFAAASANIQAEEKSGDKYTMRSRPSFMYIIELVLLMNYFILPCYDKFYLHQASAPFPLPTNLLTLFGACLLGYTTYDKVNEFLGMSGESKIVTPLITLSNDTKKGK
jgi:hypothetical protein